ncbi:MAG TPA: DUF3854 domain-containing protein, partial [Opitutaceae bacterium]|nr:DUF3854 domain-containing protein [Opitutaceae bacterium]
MDKNSNSSPQVKRPGISVQVLERAGVRHVEAIEAEQLVGFRVAGILIPYQKFDGSPVLTPDGKPFNRLRPDRPSSGSKYLSPKDGGAQIYFPPGLRNLQMTDRVLGAVEGEFKALAMVEAGFPCIGIGGISSACRRSGDGTFELLPDLAALIAEVQPSAVAFIGDGDTALISDFSREACKVAMAANVPVVLPRISLDGPKAPDDLREIHGETFPVVWNAIMAKAETVTADTKPAALAVRLLLREIDALGKLRGDAREKAKRQIVRLGAAYFDESLEVEEIAAVAKELGVGKQVFRSAIKAEYARNSAAAAAARKHALARDVAERKEPALIFDGVSYWRREKGGEWGRLTREDARLHLGVLGFNLTQHEGQPSAADYELHRIQQNHRVNFAGPLCGRPAGIHMENGIAVLATRGPRMIETQPG